MVQRGEEIAGADRTRDARSTSAISGLDLTRPGAIRSSRERRQGVSQATRVTRKAEPRDAGRHADALTETLRRASQSSSDHSLGFRP